MMKMSQVLLQLERIYDHLRPHFEDRLQIEMPDPVIVVHPGGSRGFTGMFCPNKWIRKEDGTTSHELMVSAEHLEESLEEITLTVAHEMVHLANELRGVKDCNGNQYHNKHFRDACEKVGLACEPRDPITGYGQTYLIWDFERLIKQMDIDESVFSAYRKAPPKRKKRKRSEPYPKKWMCGCTEITCPETVTALCENCGREFKRPEDYRASLRAEEEFLSRFSLFG